MVFLCCEPLTPSLRNPSHGATTYFKRLDMCTQYANYNQSGALPTRRS